MLGWLCAMGWQCAIVSIAFLAGTIIQGLIVLNNPNYDFQRWHGTLLVIAITLFSIIFNTFLAKRLPFVEVLILILHVCGLFAIVIPLWVLAPRRSAKQVFTEFNNVGAWNSAGTATLVGFSTTITALIGYDCAVHMCTSLSEIETSLILSSRGDQRCV
jgi:amino acid transporter